MTHTQVYASAKSVIRSHGDTKCLLLIQSHDKILSSFEIFLQLFAFSIAAFDVLRNSRWNEIVSKAVVRKHESLIVLFIAR